MLHAGHTDAITGFSFYRRDVVALANNRYIVYNDIAQSQGGEITGTMHRLRESAVLATTINVLPVNQMLLLGYETGHLSLVA